MLGLRLREGLDEDSVRNCCVGPRGAERERAIADAVARGLLEHVAGRLRFTRAGLLLADEVLAELVSGRLVNWPYTGAMLAFAATLVASFSFFATPGDPPATGSEAPPVKVFVLAGQSNMEGQGVVDLAGRDYNEGHGTLVELFEKPATARSSPSRNPDGSWRVRDDVYVQLHAGRPAGRGRTARPWLHAVPRPASLRPRARTRARPGRRDRRAGSPGEDRVGREEPLRRLPAALGGRDGRALLHADDRRRPHRGGHDRHRVAGGEGRLAEIAGSRSPASGTTGGTMAAIRPTRCRSTRPTSST